MLGWLNTLNLSDSYSCGEEEHAQRDRGERRDSTKNRSIKESVWVTFAGLWCWKREAFLEPAEDKTPAAIIHVRKQKMIILRADNAEHQLNVIIPWCGQQKHPFLQHLSFWKTL